MFDLDNIFTHLLSMTQGCVMTLTQSHISNVKVTVHIYLKSVSGLLLLTAKCDLDNISHNCPWPNGVSWPCPKVISPRSRSQCTHTQNFCPGHNSSLPSVTLIVFHTIVVHDPKLCAGHNSLMPSWILIIYHTIISWPWFRVISQRSRLQFTHGNFFPHHYL